MLSVSGMAPSHHRGRSAHGSTRLLLSGLVLWKGRRVAADTVGDRSVAVAVVIVDNNGRSRRAAGAARLIRTTRLTRAAGAALSTAAGAAGTTLTAATAATAAGCRVSDSGNTCGCAQNQRAGNETCPECPNSAT